VLNPFIRIAPRWNTNRFDGGEIYDEFDVKGTIAYSNFAGFGHPYYARDYLESGTFIYRNSRWSFDIFITADGSEW